MIFFTPRIPANESTSDLEIGSSLPPVIFCSQISGISCKTSCVSYFSEEVKKTTEEKNATTIE
jgi:hypothetical protein